MDDLSEPTVILNTIKEFNEFLGRGRTNTTRETNDPSTPRQRLNFSNGEMSDSNNSHNNDSSFNNMSYSRKRQLNELTGLSKSFYIYSYVKL